MLVFVAHSSGAKKVIGAPHAGQTQTREPTAILQKWNYIFESSYVLELDERPVGPTHVSACRGSDEVETLSRHPDEQGCLGTRARRRSQ